MLSTSFLEHFHRRLLDRHGSVEPTDQLPEPLKSAKSSGRSGKSWRPRPAKGAGKTHRPSMQPTQPNPTSDFAHNHLNISVYSCLHAFHLDQPTIQHQTVPCWEPRLAGAWSHAIHCFGKPCPLISRWRCWALASSQQLLWPPLHASAMPMSWQKGA